MQEYMGKNNPRTHAQNTGETNRVPNNSPRSWRDPNADSQRLQRDFDANSDAGSLRSARSPRSSQDVRSMQAVQDTQTVRSAQTAQPMRSMQTPQPAHPARSAHPARNSNVVIYSLEDTHETWEDQSETIPLPANEQFPNIAGQQSAQQQSIGQQSATGQPPVYSNDATAYDRSSYIANSNPRASAAAAARGAYSRRKTMRRANALGIILAVVIAIAIAIIVIVATFAPITVNVNGNDVEIGGEKTVAEAFNASNVTVTPGNVVDVEGAVLQNGTGDAYSATVNGEDSQPDHALSNGDVVVFSDGLDVEEPSDVVESPAPFSASIDGVGAVHMIEGTGKDGVQATKTGSISGKTSTSIIEAPTNVVAKRFNIDTGEEKVIALTFDDGPHYEYTPQILDVLRTNNAKATFFTIGDRITDSTKPIVAQAASDGHQISTHSYDHAAGSGQGVNLGYMTAEEQVNEILKGYEAIEAATGAPASKVIRTPGGNFPESVIANLSPHITAEIGWNVDTNDWQKPGASVIASRIMQAGPGDIILMHDGGGDRSQTVAALRETLPQLTAKGYRFVTVEELLQYAQ